MIIDLAGKVLARSRLARWMQCPTCWADECLAVELAGYQQQVLARLPERHRVALRGPHGLGKSFVGALVVLWFATTRDLAGVDWKVITTASAWRHLEVYLWPEIHKWAGRVEFEVLGRAPLDRRRELMDLRLKLGYGAATAVASNDPARIEGAHADSLLYLLDEAKTIPAPVWDAVEGAFSGAGTDTGQEAFALAMSTPGPPAGRFYDIHRRAAGYEDWWVRHVTLEEAIAAGRISRQWAEQRERQWGPGSAMYHNRVLGEFWASDEDAVVPLAWLEAAIERWHDWDRAGRPSPGGPLWTGVDVGRGGDESVLALRDGWAVVLEADRRRDTMATVAKVQGRPGRSIVDVIGLGAGVFDRLRELGAQPMAYTGSGRTPARDRSGKYGFTNCLTDPDRVAPIGTLRRVYRARYEGPMFEIETARGDHFTATPNHQVFTPEGWVAVQSLRVGDQLGDPFGCDATGRVAPAGPEVDHVPAEIGEIYRAADRLFGAERVQGGAVNFHGDVPVGDVEVVTIDRDLLAVGETGGEAAQDIQLIRSLLGSSAFPSLGRADQGLVIPRRDVREGAAFPGDRVPGGTDTAFLPGHPGHDQFAGLGAVPALNTPIVQRSGDDPAVHPILLGQGEHRLSGQVPADHLITGDAERSAEPGHIATSPESHPGLGQHPADDVLIHAEIPRQTGYGVTSPVAVDQVVSIKIINPSGHGHLVYTLETETGTYRSQYTTHKNCRSAAYWNIRELLDPAYDPVLALPPDDLLISDLTTPTWGEATGVPPKIKVEEKDAVVARLGRSPDRGDAVAMAMWADRMRGQVDHAEPVGALPTTSLGPLGR